MNAPFTLPRHRLTVQDFHRMGQAGIFHEDSQVELLDGDIIDMAPIGSLHSGIVNKLSAMLIRQAEGKTIVSTQNPLSLPPDSEPQPDIMLLKQREDWYYQSLPTAEDALLVIEIADTSIEQDRLVKCPLYARHGIPEMWLFDLTVKTLEIYQEPSKNGYRKLLRPEMGEVISLLLLPEIRVKLVEIWPS